MGVVKGPGHGGVRAEGQGHQEVEEPQHRESISLGSLPIKQTHTHRLAGLAEGEHRNDSMGPNREKKREWLASVASAVICYP